MSPRIIHNPLSGRDRNAQAKGIRYAHGIDASAYRESVLIRSAAEAKLREADRLECEAWNAIMWASGPAMPSPGDPQAEPMIGKASTAVLVCSGPSATGVTVCTPSGSHRKRRSGSWKPPPCIASPAAPGARYSERQRAHILGLTYASLDPEPGRIVGRKKG